MVKTMQWHVVEVQNTSVHQGLLDNYNRLCWLSSFVGIPAHDEVCTL